MKIGIITFHRVLNYGAVLQGYALQKSIEKLGHKTEVIDYRSASFEQEYRSKKPASLTLRGVYDFFRSRKVEKKDAAFMAYIGHELHLSEMCETHEKLKKVSKDYDLVITGSDQVFNLPLTHKDGAYFLDFVDSSRTRKASYAASIGISNLIDADKAAMKRYLQDFSAISVREVKAQEQLRELGFSDTMIHIDPSLLLTCEEWKHYSRQYDEAPYVLIYSVRKEPELLALAKHLAEEHGLKIRYIKYMNERIPGVEVIPNAGPAEFVDFFSNASFVVTNLFHGTAFSIALQREFYVVYQKGAKTNNRIEHLLTSVGLCSRICKEKSQIDTIPIDYNRVEEKLSSERSRSIDYLRQISKE